MSSAVLPASAPRVPEQSRLRVAVLASGRGSNFSALLDATRDGRLPILLCGVFSDRPQAPVLDIARAAGVPTAAISPRRFDDRPAHERALFAEVDRVQPDLIVCAGYMRILGADALIGRSSRMINIHPSLLPKYRGLHTHQRALDAGDRQHGASVHFVTAELDGGPVISQALIDVKSDDTAETLASRLLQREHPLLCASVALFAEGRVALSDGRVWVDGAELPSPLALDPQGRLGDAA